MAVDNTILVRRGSGTPTYSDFTEYELAYDYTGNKLYIRDGNAMEEIGGLSTINNSNWSGTDLEIAHGGTGASTASGARSNLGIVSGHLATAAVSNGATTLATGNAIYDHVTSRISGLTSNTGTVDTSGTPIAQEYARFTDANTVEGRSAAGVRTDLGLVVGTNIQAQDTLLQDIADLSLNNATQHGYVLAYNDTSSTLELVAPSAGTITSVTGMTNNNVLTASGSTTISGESKLTFDNSFLELTDSQLRLDNSTFGTYNWEFQQDDGGDLLFKVPSTGGAEIRISADGGSNSWKTANVLIAGEISLHADGTSYFKQGATPLVLGGTSAYTTGGTPRLSIQGGGLNIGNGTNNMSYIRSTVAGEYQWQTWNGANDGELQLQPYGGKVGIGTSSPQVKLDVAGDIASSGSLVLPASHAYDKIKLYGSTGHERIGTEGGTIVLTASNFKFRDYTSGATRFFVSSSGVITSGAWEGTTIASAYLDADTAHLSGTQTFSGAKTFSNGINVGDLSNGGIIGSNYNITGVNAISFNDPGAGEGLTFSNFQIFESPDNLDNAAGNIQFVTGGSSGTRRATIDTSGNLYVQNNITLGGTVDGRNIANDGSKLDGIASGATANTGDITNVAAGTGLSGGGSSGGVTLNVDSSVFKDLGTINVTTTSDGSNTNPFDDAHVETRVATNGVYDLSYTGASGFMSSAYVGGSASVFQQGAHYNGTDFYMRVRTDSSSWKPWRKLWHNGNDGSGSGLDADKLDSLHASSFPRRGNLAENTASSITTFNSNDAINTSTGNQSGLQVYQDTGGADAFMTFHVNGDHALYFGLDGGTNDLAVGGWSKGANSYKIWHQGNDGSGSGLDADTLDGLQLESTDRNDNANRVVRTQSNGYAMFGWINTNSGNTTTASSDYYVNTDDGYIRKKTLAAVRTEIMGVSSGSEFWSKSGNWAGDLTSNGWSRVQGVSSGGGEFVLAQKNGQVSTLIDGSYFAYEAGSNTGGGFWSSSNSSYGAATGIIASGTTLYVKQADGGNADLAVTGNMKLTNERGLLWDYTPNTGLGGYIAHPGGGMYRTSTGTHTGALTVTIPSGGGPADMISFWVDVFDYTSYESQSFYIAGYVYQSAGSNEWVNETALMLTPKENHARTVRFGHNGTNHVVYIGELADNWSYPQVTVRNVQVGYNSDVDTYDDNWDISFEASAFQNVDATYSGADTLPTAGKIKMKDGAGKFNHNATSSRDKIRVWDNGAYAIGMEHSNNYGGLANQYAMTFTMDGTTGRGFLWAKYDHTKSQGAMSLTNDGKLAVADSMHLGYGINNTSSPGGTYKLDVNGNAYINGTTYLNGTLTGSTIRLGYNINDSNSIGCSNWFRSSGNSGWYNGTYGGGIYMQDTTWVRTYASKALYIGNTIAASGDITAYYSDERLKTKIENIDNAIDKVMSLEGFIYEENKLAEELGYNNKGKRQVGVSAQQIQKVLPEAVTLAAVDMETDKLSGEITSKSGENYLTVKYDKIVPLLIEAIKEQQVQIDELKTKLGE